jgi:class 3 adenylate cyclase
VTAAGVRGPAVETAMRIAERAEAGQILVSTTIRDLVAGSGIRFRGVAKTITGNGSDAISLLLVDEGAAGHGALRQPA